MGGYHGIAQPRTLALTVTVNMRDAPVCPTKARVRELPCVSLQIETGQRLSELDQSEGK